MNEPNEPAGISQWDAQKRLGELLMTGTADEAPVESVADPGEDLEFVLFDPHAPPPAEPQAAPA